MTAGDNLPARRTIDARARAVLEAHWRPEGYCVPNLETYPFQWLWDSCFHAVVWAHLGEGDRALAEIGHLFRTQDESGFVPHVDYEVDPDVMAPFWGRPGASSITQPPMYGHALAELARRGIMPSSELVDQARRGLQFLLEVRARDAATGLVTIVHPWESGADDSPRWDDWCGHAFDSARWYERKGELLREIVRSDAGAPLANPAFGAAPAAFNALLVFNATELATLAGDEGLHRQATELADQLQARFDPHLATWRDAGPAADGSGSVRTLDALLVALVDRTRADQVLSLVVDPLHYGGRTGPAGVHREEPAFSPRRYWRGPAWPQLTYLLWLAAGDRPVRRTLAEMLVRGAFASDFAEYWDPDEGTGLGAAPQSWTALAAVVAPSLD